MKRQISYPWWGRVALGLFWPIIASVLLAMIVAVMCLAWPLVIFGKLYKTDEGKYNIGL